ncbi:DUF5777 family beta-barrel protein [Mariniphaga sp.]|uniref:DUF5777 family beta-barrel protein n=1 Tax=Mariniphaga sp. TaxID=1954475 RepID=UPI00356A1822
MKIFLFSVLYFLFVLNLGAQDESEEVKIIEHAFQGTRFVNEQSVNLADQGELRLYIQHRFGEIDGGLYELFGLDQATMRLGFEYGLGKNLNVGFGRSTYLKTYDVYAKGRIAGQTETFPLSIGLVAAGSIPTLRNFPDNENNFSSKFSGNIQLLLAKTMGPVGLQVSPGYLKTGYLLFEEKAVSTFTAGFAGSMRISSKVSANIEYLYPFTDKLPGSNPLSLGVDINTGGHLFQLILSNSQQIFTQGLYTATHGNWGDGKLFFGFNLIREFRIKYY